MAISDANQLSGYGTSPVTCPACGQTFTGTWTDPDAETEQACPSCGHACLARWPGWTAQPETVTVDRGSVQVTSPPAALR
jgi:DNA-directed RNA polymerase subunit RPC12/RpoP